MMMQRFLPLATLALASFTLVSSSSTANKIIASGKEFVQEHIQDFAFQSSAKIAQGCASTTGIKDCFTINLPSQGEDFK
jgi:hypothetical protein